MTDKLGFESRLLVDAARDGFGPDEIAVRRMRARIAAAVAGGAVSLAAAHVASAAATSTAATGAVATGAVGSSAAAAGAASGAIGVKLVVAAIGLAIAAGTGAGAYAVLARRTAPSAIVPATRNATTVPAAPAAFAFAPVSAVPVAPAPVAPTPIAPAVHHQPPADSRADAIRSAPARATAPHLATPAPPPARPPLSLARETQLLGEAQSELSAGRLVDAIAAVARYDAETAGRGQLAEDAAAIDVEARCKLHDASADKALDLFGVRWPHSHESARLVAECAR